MDYNAMRGYTVKRLFLVLGAVALTTLFVYCKSWKNKTPEERADVMTKRLVKELDLTSTQNAVLTKFKEELLAQHRADQAERALLFQSLIEIIRADSIDRTSLAELKKRNDAMRSRAEDLFLDKVVELHKILNPSQRIRAADALLKYKQKFSGEK